MKRKTTKPHASWIQHEARFIMVYTLKPICCMLVEVVARDTARLRAKVSAGFATRDRISRAPDVARCTLESEYPGITTDWRKRSIFICRFTYEAWIHFLHCVCTSGGTKGKNRKDQVAATADIRGQFTRRRAFPKFAAIWLPGMRKSASERYLLSWLLITAYSHIRTRPYELGHRYVGDISYVPVFFIDLVIAEIFSLLSKPDVAHSIPWHSTNMGKCIFIFCRHALSIRAISFPKFPPTPKSRFGDKCKFSNVKVLNFILYRIAVFNRKYKILKGFVIASANDRIMIAMRLYEGLLFSRENMGKPPISELFYFSGNQSNKQILLLHYCQ